MRILLAIDYSNASERAIREIASRTWPPRSIIRVFSVVENSPPSAAELWFDGEGSLDRVRLARRERTEELVGAAAERIGRSGVTTETALSDGGRRGAISREAKSWGADVTLDATRRLPDLDLFGAKRCPPSW